MSIDLNNIDDSDEVYSSKSVDESDEIEILKEAPTSTHKRKAKKKSKAPQDVGKRKKNSDVWDHFAEIANDDVHAKCLYCRAAITCS